MVVSKVGRELYEQASSAATRASTGSSTRRSSTRPSARACPSCANRDDRYFIDAFQGLPADGYTALFERMLDHPRIDVHARRRLSGGRAARLDHDHLIYTGPIDDYFGCRFGALPYRSLRFEHETPDPDGGLVQPCGDGQLPVDDVPSRA